MKSEAQALQSCFNTFSSFLCFSIPRVLAFAKKKKKNLSCDVKDPMQLQSGKEFMCLVCNIGHVTFSLQNARPFSSSSCPAGLIVTLSKWQLPEGQGLVSLAQCGIYSS
jgi:hypothetical protein